MNSKQRVLNAFNRIKSDRVPLDYSTNPTIHEKVQKALKVNSYEGVLKAFNIDFRGVGAGHKGPLIYPKIEGLEVNPVYGFYTKWVPNEHGGYYDFCNFPLKDASGEKIRSFPVPSPDDFDYSNVYDHCQKNKEYAIYCGDAGKADIINSTGRVMGMEDALVNLQTEDEATLDYISRRCDMEIGVLERVLDKAKGGIDFMWLGEDLGTQIAPMISLDLYRRVLRPFHQRYIDLAKAYKLPVMIHTCGSSSWAYEDFIEMGINCVDTLQPEAKNMDPAYLVKRFGGRLSFHGCISTAGALAYSTPGAVEADVKKTLEIMKPTYSYMLAPTHSIQDNTPVENILRLYESALRLGKY